jgi:single-stranded DNA-binding protein
VGSIGFPVGSAVVHLRLGTGRGIILLTLGNVLRTLMLGIISGEQGNVLVGLLESSGLNVGLESERRGISNGFLYSMRWETQKTPRHVMVQELSQVSSSVSSPGEDSAHEGVSMKMSEEMGEEEATEETTEEPYSPPVKRATYKRCPRCGTIVKVRCKSCPSCGFKRKSHRPWGSRFLADGHAASAEDIGGHYSTDWDSGM